MGDGTVMPSAAPSETLPFSLASDCVTGERVVSASKTFVSADKEIQEVSLYRLSPDRQQGTNYYFEYP